MTPTTHTNIASIVTGDEDAIVQLCAWVRALYGRTQTHELCSSAQVGHRGQLREVAQGHIPADPYDADPSHFRPAVAAPPNPPSSPRACFPRLHTRRLTLTPLRVPPVGTASLPHAFMCMGYAGFVTARMAPRWCKHDEHRREKLSNTKHKSIVAVANHKAEERRIAAARAKRRFKNHLFTMQHFMHAKTNKVCA